MTDPIVDRHGNQCWFNSKNEYHREDGPAVVSPNGHQCWYKMGLLHRTDGPAFINKNGAQAWWVNGFRVKDQDMISLLTGNEYDLLIFKLKFGLSR